MTRGEAISAALRKVWMERHRGIGLEAMRAAAKPGECPFCGDPCRQKSMQPSAVAKRRAAGTGDYQDTCGEPECKAAYFRYYQRDRRARQHAPQEAA